MWHNGGCEMCRKWTIWIGKKKWKTCRIRDVCIWMANGRRHTGNWKLPNNQIKIDRCFSVLFSSHRLPRRSWTGKQSSLSQCMGLRSFLWKLCCVDRRGVFNNHFCSRIYDIFGTLSYSRIQHAINGWELQCGRSTVHSTAYKHFTVEYSMQSIPSTRL